MIELFTTPEPNQVAVDRLKSLAPVTRAQFDKLLPDLRAYAFTVTGVDDANTLQRLRDLVAELPAGKSWDEVKGKVAAEISPWIIDAGAPPEEQAQQAKATVRRAELILRTHGFRAYAVARHRDQVANSDIQPWWEYRSFGDNRVRDTHAALDGVILAWDDPFWADHYPPWDWGCRCIVIGVSDNRYRMIVEAEQGKAPDERNTFEGRRLEDLRAGRLVRGPGKQFDIRPPVDRATSPIERATAWRFRPGEMQPDLETLRSRYSPETWRGFEGWARSTKLPDGRTVWNWAGGQDIVAAGEAPAPAPTPGAMPKFDEVLADAGIQANDPDTWTAKAIRDVIKGLKKPEAVKVSDHISEIRGDDNLPGLDAKTIRSATQEFLDLIPRDVLKALPKAEITVVNQGGGALGQYQRNDDRITLFGGNIVEHEKDMKATLWHELTHWVHIKGPQWYRDKIRDFYAERTKGDRPQRVGFSHPVKKDKWWWDYAGTMYPHAPDEGLEVPTTHLELLAEPVKLKSQIRKHGKTLVDALRVAASILTGEKA